MLIIKPGFIERSDIDRNKLKFKISADLLSRFSESDQL